MYKVKYSDLFQPKQPAYLDNKPNKTQIKTIRNLAGKSNSLKLCLRFWFSRWN